MVKYILDEIIQYKKISILFVSSHNRKYSQFQWTVNTIYQIIWQPYFEMYIREKVME